MPRPGRVPAVHLRRLHMGLAAGSSDGVALSLGLVGTEAEGVKASRKKWPQDLLAAGPDRHYPAMSVDRCFVPGGSIQPDRARHIEISRP